MKKKLIEDNIFYSFCEFVYDCGEEEFLEYANKKNGRNYTATGAQGKFIWAETEDRFLVCIWINHEENYETLAHEILHLTRFWLQDYYKIDLTKQTEEVYTLFHSFYFGQCIDFIKQSKKKKRKKNKK